MESKESSLGTPSVAASNAYAQGLTQFQGFWIPSRSVPTSSIIAFQKYFQALDDDIIVVSKPKSGTTWLKALVFSIVNLPYLDIHLYKENPNPDLSAISSPRLFSTHLPYPMLADSIKRSNCRIVYINRNPFAVIVSLWHFFSFMDDWSVEDCFEMFCKGEEGYEELKEDAVKLSEFLGFPFSIEEEKTGLVNQIVDFYSFNNLKDLDWRLTKLGRLFFRSGKVGDYVNHLSPTAVERLSNILEEKLSGRDLTFK
ncbi:hypothetical protein GOBAR_AA26607 [Gossypium barbadense]|uniref:Sulfotransferase n=1 Tax=Gossypium barbadense TaxID=3634 RepID=A0A2P5WSK7_GOSBA|nr:hypothetical protein GOBAR_AA26607 [Gossypium barbadense]